MYYYYKCSGAKRRKGCKKKADKKDWIEKLVVVSTINRVLKDEEIDKIADKLVVMQERENTVLPALRRQLAEAEKGIENILNAIQQGLYNASAKKRLDDLEAQKEDLEVSILQAELARPRYTKDEMVRWISQFKYGDVESLDYQRQIIDIFVNSIRVFDDRIIFTYNYKDGTETITLTDIEAALGSDLGGGSPLHQNSAKSDKAAASRKLAGASRASSFAKRSSGMSYCNSYCNRGNSTCCRLTCGGN